MRMKILGALWCAAITFAVAFPGAAPAQQPNSRDMRPYDEQMDLTGRPIIAMEEFRAGGGNSEVVADNMRALLISALTRDGRFVVARSTSGRENADLFIEGTATRYQTSPAGRDLQSADVEISLQVIDGKTGRTVGTVSANGNGTGGEAELSHPTDAETFSTSGLGRAGEVALKLAIPKIVQIAQNRRSQ